MYNYGIAKCNLLHWRIKVEVLVQGLVKVSSGAKHNTRNCCRPLKGGCKKGGIGYVTI